MTGLNPLHDRKLTLIPPLNQNDVVLSPPSISIRDAFPHPQRLRPRGGSLSAASFPRSGPVPYPNLRIWKPVAPVTGEATPPTPLPPRWSTPLMPRRPCPPISSLNCGPLIPNEPRGTYVSASSS